jgi:hypothetical protein
MSAIAPISTITENATDVLHTVGSRLVLPDDVADGLGALSDAITPTTTLAVGAGTRAAVAGGRTVLRHPLLVVGGVLAVVAALVWFAKKRVDDDSGASLRAEHAAGARSVA